MTLAPLGDSAVVIDLGSIPDEALFSRVRAVAAAIRRARLAWVQDVVAAFATVTVFYDAERVESYERLSTEIESLVAGATKVQAEPSPRVVEIPVCYGGEFGPDLDAVVVHTGIPSADVIARHRAGEYRVQAIGFAPGFPYLTGLPRELHTPRRARPRTAVPAGSVGIGGAQTGVYSLETPGGWNLIGRTPLHLFDASRTEPALLRTGDRVRFRSISPEEFAAWK